MILYHGTTRPEFPRHIGLCLAAEHGVEAVWFSDEDPHGQGHDTLRLLTAAAVAAIVSSRVLPESP